MKRLTVFAILILFLAACAPKAAPMAAAAGPAAYYVSPAGSDSNAGTIAAPFATIQHAVDAMSGGDTVYLRGGTYNQAVKFYYKADPTNLYMTLTAYPGEIPVIDGTNIPGNDYNQEGLVYVKQTNYVRISGLKIQNANQAGIYVGYADHVEVSGNKTYDTVKSGIGYWYVTNGVIDGNDVQLACKDHTGYVSSEEPITVNGGSFIEVKNNIVHNGPTGQNPARAGGEGINVKSDAHDISIHNNQVFGLSDKLGFGVDAWGGQLHDIKIYNNVAHDNYVGALLENEGAGGLATNVYFYGNELYNNQFGIYIPDYEGNGPKSNFFITSNNVHDNKIGLAVNSVNITNVVIKDEDFTRNTIPVQVGAGVPINQIVYQNSSTATPETPTLTATQLPTATATRTPTTQPTRTATMACILIGTYPDGTREYNCKQ